MLHLRKYLRITLAVLSAVITLVASAEYTPNAFAIQNEDSHQIITNQDINCVRINGKNSASIKLTAEARRFFYEFTNNNKGKSLTTMLCGKPLTTAKIMSPISGEFTISNLKKDHLRCLKSSFDTKAVCYDCRVCKNDSSSSSNGFKLSRINGGSLFEKWGLKNGDTIISINDQRLTNKVQAIGVLNSLKGKKNAILKIQRNGETKTINIKED